MYIHGLKLRRHKKMTSCTKCMLLVGRQSRLYEVL